MIDRPSENIKRSLVAHAQHIFGKKPVLFAYLYGSFATGIVHPFSDLDVGIFVGNISSTKYLELELFLSLEIDEKMDSCVASEVRIINDLPLVIKGEIITNGLLIFSKNEEARIDFETSIRSAYFDFLPVLYNYRNAYLNRFASN